MLLLPIVIGVFMVGDKSRPRKELIHLQKLSNSFIAKYQKVKKK